MTIVTSEQFHDAQHEAGQLESYIKEAQELMDSARRALRDAPNAMKLAQAQIDAASALLAPLQAELREYEQARARAVGEAVRGVLASERGG